MKKKIHYGWFMFIGCCMMQMCIVGAVVNSAGLFYTPICNELGFGRGELALYMTFGNLATMAVLPLWGKLLKKYPVKPLVSVCLVAESVSLFIMSRGQALWHWYAAGILMGLANALLMMLVTPVILSNWFEKNLGLVTGIAMSFSGIGGALINPIGARMIEAFGWRTTQGIIALIPVVIMLPYVLIVYHLHPSEIGLKAYGADESRHASSLAEDGFTARQAFHSVLFPLTVLFVVFVSFGASYPTYLPSLADSLGKTITVGATLISLSMMGNVAGKLILGWINDHFGVKSAAMFGAGGLIVAYLSLIASIKTGSSALLVIGSALSGFAMSLGAVMQPLITRAMFGSRDYSTIYSYVSMGGSFSIAVSGAAIGFIYDITSSYLVSFMIGVGVYVGVILCLIALFALKKKEVPKEEYNY